MMRPRHSTDRADNGYVPGKWAWGLRDRYGEDDPESGVIVMKAYTMTEARAALIELNRCLENHPQNTTRGPKRIDGACIPLDELLALQVPSISPQTTMAKPVERELELSSEEQVKRHDPGGEP